MDNFWVAVLAGGIVAGISSVLAHGLQSRRDGSNRRKDLALRAIDEAVAAIRDFCAVAQAESIHPLRGFRASSLVVAQRLLYADVSVIDARDAVGTILDFANDYVWSFPEVGTIGFVREIFDRWTWKGDRSATLAAAVRQLIEAQQAVVVAAKAQRARILES